MDYTLSPPLTSYLRIGVSKSDVVSKLSFTHLLVNPLSPTFYYTGNKGIFADGAMLLIRPSVWSLDEFGYGGTVIDSGTTLTFVPELAYRLILAAFKQSLRLASPTQLNSCFDLCVNVSGVAQASLPKLSFGLVGDSVFSLPLRNYFIEMSDRVKCLAIQPVVSVKHYSKLKETHGSLR